MLQTSIIDDRLARRNALLLAVAQALYSSTIIILVATSGLVGLTLAPDRSWATMPMSVFVIGTMVSTVPASMLMQRIGRRAGFMIGAFIGCAGALLAVLAILTANFWLFCAACALQGVFQASSQYFRFAAADQASPAFKPKAISWVLTGGVAAAVIGTVTAANTADVFAPFTFAGSYAANAVLALATAGVLAFLAVPPPSSAAAEGTKRPFSEILRQPRLIVAVATATLAYGMMNLMMTATPIAMVDCGFSKDTSFWVIMMHVLAMFLPSFFTGHIITLFGAARVAAAGRVLLIAAAVIALAGIQFANFSVALILLGLGWNFGFIGGTTLLTDCYRPSERAKVQAFNDFAISATMAAASLASGKLLALFGWNTVAIALFPMAALALGLIAWGFMGGKRAAEAQDLSRP